MILPNPPSRENYLYEEKAIIKIPLNWLKWFAAVYKILYEINAEFIRTHTVDSTALSLTLTDAHGTVLVTADAQTITLPAASLARIGKDWTVIFGTTGTCTIVCAGSDTFPAVTSATETTAVMVSRGDSLTFRCTTATTWGMV